MVIEEAVRAALIAAAGITSLVPAARVKDPGDWQQLARPYIVHFPVSLDPSYTHEGLLGLRKWPYYQISCFGDTYSSAKGVAEAVRAALGNYRDSSGTVMFWRGERYVGFEPDVKVHQIAMDFEVWESL